MTGDGPIPWGTVTTNGTYRGLSVFQRSEQWNWIGQQYEEAEAGETYCFSVYARIAKEQNAETCQFGMSLSMSVNGNSLNSTKYVQISHTWKRYSITYTLTESGTLNCNFTKSSAEVIICETCGYKLERGTIPTDWTPAPEDIEARLSALEAKLNTP